MIVTVETKASRSSKAVTLCSIDVENEKEFKGMWRNIGRVFAENQESPSKVFDGIQNFGFQNFGNRSKLPKTGHSYLRLRLEDESYPDLLTSAYHIAPVGNTYMSEMVSSTDGSFCCWPFDLVQLVMNNSRGNPENWEILMLDMDDTFLVKEFSDLDEAMETFELLVENGVSWDVMKDFEFKHNN